MMIGIFAQTNERLLFCFAVPFDDAPIFRTGVNVLPSYLKRSNTQFMPAILNCLAQPLT